MDKGHLIKDKITGKNHLVNDGHSSYYIQKAQKLAIALHLITNLFPEGEPLRTAIRDKSICLLSNINKMEDSLKMTNIKPSPDIFVNIVSDIDLMLDVAKSIKLVSEMNHSILKREFQIFLNVEDKKPLLGDNFFETKRIGINTFKGQNLKDEISIIAVKDKNVLQNKKTFKRKNNRKDLIISVLKVNEGTSVKDICKVVKGCSDKTIQRQLNLMALGGEVKREGTRRWARYYLLVQ